MSPENAVDVDHALHEAVVGLVRDHGAQSLSWLVARARPLRRDARVDEQAVINVVECSTMLVPQVDGRIGWLGELLDGIVLTHRVRAPLAGRRDLWGGVAIQPLLNIAAYAPLPLASGGEVTRMESGQDVLIGPAGWLPDVPRFGLVALRWKGGTLKAEPVPEDLTHEPQELQAVRALVASHYRRERWWRGDDDLESRPGELVRAITLAKMEDPEFLSVPYPPLDEILYNPLQRDVDEHHWRDLAAANQTETISFWLGDVPAALHGELNRRAGMYGMSLDQFVIAILGHLAWRTPFAEDCKPFEWWVPDASEKAATVRPLGG